MSYFERCWQGSGNQQQMTKEPEMSNSTRLFLSLGLNGQGNEQCLMNWMRTGVTQEGKPEGRHGHCEMQPLPESQTIRQKRRWILQSHPLFTPWFSAGVFHWLNLSIWQRISVMKFLLILLAWAKRGSQRSRKWYWVNWANRKQHKLWKLSWDHSSSDTNLGTIQMGG